MIKNILIQLPPDHPIIPQLLPEIISVLKCSVKPDEHDPSVHPHVKILPVVSVTLAVLRALNYQATYDPITESCQPLVRALFSHWDTNSMVHAVLVKLARCIVKKQIQPLFSILCNHAHTSEIEAHISMKPYYCIEDTDKLKPFIEATFHSSSEGDLDGT